MFRVDSLGELRELLVAQPELWSPDPLLLLQEYLPHDPQDRGIVRLEYLGGELLYAMLVSSDGGFNLCPSEICNPLSKPEVVREIEGAGREAPRPAPRFHPYPQVPAEHVETGLRIMRAGGFDVGAVEYLETDDGRVVFYDVNANSNLRAPVAAAFGFDPFERVVDHLEWVLAQERRQGVALA